jgi:hypothetical protein
MATPSVLWPADGLAKSATVTTAKDESWTVETGPTGGLHLPRDTSSAVVSSSWSDAARLNANKPDTSIQVDHQSMSRVHLLLVSRSHSHMLLL